MTITISGRRGRVFLRHDNNNIGQKRRGGCSTDMTITIWGRRGRAFVRHANNDIGQKR